jgi:mono/diheme cytochrome c family protein
VLRTNFGVTTDPRHPPPPVSGGTLTVLTGGLKAVAADPDRDHVYVVDLAQWKLAFDVALQPGDEPGRVAEGPPGKAFVALRRAGAVVTIDTATGAIAERRAVCAAPRGMAYDAAKGRLHVACAEGVLVTLPASGQTAQRRLALPDDLRDVVIIETGLLVSRFRSAQVLRLNEAGAVMATLTPKPTEEGFEASVAWRLRADPGGGAFLFHQMSLATAITIDGSPAVTMPQHLGTYQSSGGGCGSIVQAAVTMLRPDDAMYTSPSANTALPVDGVYDPLTASAALIDTATRTEAFLNVGSVNLVSVTGDPGCGRFEQPTQRLAFPLPADSVATPPGQPIAIDATPEHLVVQSREPTALWRDDGRVLILSTERHADVGHAIFHASTRGLACASCHPEGGEDGRVWKFDPIGSRRTISLRGGLTGTEPLHWDGDLPTLGALVEEVWGRRMQAPALADDQIAELRRWIDSLPALPRVAGDAAVVARGRALFEDATAACSTCHAGALTTNNTSVDVGTGRSMQVPSLRGLSWRAPYLHDGCAATLTARFGACGGGDKHGHTSQLTPTQIADLVAYLQSL